MGSDAVIIIPKSAGVPAREIERCWASEYTIERAWGHDGREQLIRNTRRLLQAFLIASRGQEAQTAIDLLSRLAERARDDKPFLNCLHKIEKRLDHLREDPNVVSRNVHDLQNRLAEFQEALLNHNLVECCSISRDIRCSIIALWTLNEATQLEHLIRQAVSRLKDAERVTSSTLAAKGSGDELQYIRSRRVHLEEVSNSFADQSCELQLEESRSQQLLRVMRDSKWEFWSVPALANKTQLPALEIERILEKNPGLFRRSPVPDASGDGLFTLATRPIRWRERFALLRKLLVQHTIKRAVRTT